MGMHGAAIVHGLFMSPGTISIEMKTLYAYESILFFIIADARAGIHGQVDIRKYFLKTDAHSPVDDPLIERMLAALQTARQMQSTASCESKQLLRPLAAAAGDFALASQCPESQFSHILGPWANESLAICERMALTKVMTDSLHFKDNKPLHCPVCPGAKRRLNLRIEEDHTSFRSYGIEELL